MKNKHIKGDGKLYLRGNIIWVCGSVNGVFVRKSTGQKLTTANKRWMEKANPKEVLLELLGEERSYSGNVYRHTLESFGKYVIELTKSKRGKATQEDYIRILENKIAPFFGDVALDSIQPIEIIKFLETMKTQVCGDRVRRIKNLLTLIFDYAADNELIEMNKNIMRYRTVENVKMDYTPTNNKAYTRKEASLMLSNAKGWLKVYLELSFRKGIRPGELMGLKWCDICFDTGKIDIQRTVYKGSVKEAKNNPKSNKNHNRIIYADPDTLELLKAHYEQRGSDEWVFVNKKGKMFRESKTINTDYIQPLLTQLKLSYKSIYSARRSYATFMLYAAEYEKEFIQDEMGHKRGSKITEKHYVDGNAIDPLLRQQKAIAHQKIFNQIIGLEDKESK